MQNSTLQSKIQNFFTIFVISAFLFLPAIAKAAELSLETNSNSFVVNSIFKVLVRLDVSREESVNALDVYLKFPNQLVSLEEVSFGNSILTTIDNPIIDKTQGIVSFSGIIPGGYSDIIDDNILGPSNLLATLYFKVLKPGLTNIEFLNNSKALLNDGLGTPAPLTTKNIQLNLIPLDKTNSNLLVDEWSLDTKKDNQAPIITNFQFVKISGLYYLVFNAVDKESGINHYEIKSYALLLSALNFNTWIKTHSPYPLPPFPFLFNLTVKAVDNAGNQAIEAIA